jgi:methionyl aminopeptidase
MIHLRSASEIEQMRSSCVLVAGLLDALAGLIRPGVNTLELDRFAEDYVLSRGGKPAFKGYRVPGLNPFPGTICASVNSAIVHGIPSEKAVLQEGDIIGIDVGVLKDGFYGDGARTYAVGEVSPEANRLMRTTREALTRGIEAAREGNRVGDISHAIGSYVSALGYYVADSLTGHGVGRELHEEPQIPNAGPAGRGPRLKAGMTLAIEPMVNIGTNRVKEVGWEFFVADDSLSAHYEHTILVTQAEPVILTQASGASL